MSYRRFAAARGRKDANHSDIVKALKRCGAIVVDMSVLGGGVPDILVGYQGRSLLMEIKTGAKATHDATVRQRQADFAATWRGDPVVTVRSELDALQALGVRVDT